MSISQSASVWVSVDRVECFFWTSTNWDSASHDSLQALGSDGTGATCTSGGATRELMSNEPRLFDLCHDGRLDRRTIAKCTRQHNYGVVGTLEKLCSLTFTVPRWRICESITSFPQPMPRRRDVEWCAPRGSQRTRSQMIRLSWSEVGCTGVSRPRRRQTTTLIQLWPRLCLPIQPGGPINVTQSHLCLMSAERTSALRTRGTLLLSFPTASAK